ARVAPGSPAARAGLRGLDPQAGAIGDVIIAVDGVPVHSLADVARGFEKAGVGANVELTLRRDGARHRLSVTVIDLNAG
ncbi:MAG: PDZ domain-containing protein, partial [Alphaproteobacteria bacterium]|nr:PDZ domain-containing protein [Alphaproteobacteria bacterium]